MGREFKQFLLRGNVVDLAVGVVMGAAFGAIVNSLVGDMVTPLIGAIVGKHDFGELHFTVNGSRFGYGTFINALISFLTIGTAIFFFVVKPVNALLARSREEPPADPTTKKCPECLSEIPLHAHRCAHCTSELEAA